MSAEPVMERAKFLKDLTPLFHDQAACSRMHPESEIYRACWWSPASPGEEGGLLWGVAILQPGKCRLAEKLSKIMVRLMPPGATFDARYPPTLATTPRPW
jgi:hypothetical protein